MTFACCFLDFVFLVTPFPQKQPIDAIKYPDDREALMQENEYEGDGDRVDEGQK